VDFIFFCHRDRWGLQIVLQGSPLKADRSRHRQSYRFRTKLVHVIIAGDTFIGEIAVLEISGAAGARHAATAVPLEVVIILIRIKLIIIVEALEHTVIIAVAQIVSIGVDFAPARLVMILISLVLIDLLHEPRHAAPFLLFLAAFYLLDFFFHAAILIL